MPMKSSGTRFAALVVLALALVASGFFFWKADEAPDVEFSTISGDRFRLRDWRGHPVLVSFWASDCRGCLEEIPDLSALHREYAGRGLRMVVVAMPYDLPSRVLATARALPFPVALDPLGRITEAFGRVQWVPNNFLIDADGRIASHHLGRLYAEALRVPIERILGAI